jgi:hypothetical protein
MIDAKQLRQLEVILMHPSFVFLHRDRRNEREDPAHVWGVQFFEHGQGLAWVWGESLPQLIEHAGPVLERFDNELQ